MRDRLPRRGRPDRLGRLRRRRAAGFAADRPSTWPARWSPRRSSTRTCTPPPTGLALTGLDLTGAAHPRAERWTRSAAHAAAAPGARAARPRLGRDRAGPRGARRPPPSSTGPPAARSVYLSRVDVHSRRGLVRAAGRRPRPGRPDRLPRRRAPDGRRPPRRPGGRARHGHRRPARRRPARHPARRPPRSASARCTSAAARRSPARTTSPALLALAAAEPGPEVYGYWGELIGRGQGDASSARSAPAATCSSTARSAPAPRACTRPTPTRDGTVGHGYLDAEQVAAHLADCAAHGMQGGFHAIGDAALRAVARTGSRRPPPRSAWTGSAPARHRIEHAEMVDAPLIKRMVEFGVVASVQPAFDAALGRRDRHVRPAARRRAGADAQPVRRRWPGVGVPLAFGSDSPVTPLDPWGAVRAAAYHRNPHHVDQRPRAAFAAHTRGGWRAIGRDDEGVLAPGAPATFAVWAADEVVVQAPDEQVSRWSTDPRGAVPGLPDLIPGAPLPTCLRTVVRGRTVFDTEETVTDSTEKPDHGAEARARPGGRPHRPPAGRAGRRARGGAGPHPHHGVGGAGRAAARRASPAPTRTGSLGEPAGRRRPGTGRPGARRGAAGVRRAGPRGLGRPDAARAEGRGGLLGQQHQVSASLVQPWRVRASKTGSATPCSRPTWARTASSRRLTHGMPSGSAPVMPGQAQHGPLDRDGRVRAGELNHGGADSGGQCSGGGDRVEAELGVQVRWRASSGRGGASKTVWPRTTVRRQVGRGRAGWRGGGGVGGWSGSVASPGVSQTAKVAGAPGASTPSSSRPMARHPPRVWAANAAAAVSTGRGCGGGWRRGRAPHGSNGVTGASDPNAKGTPTPSTRRTG